MQSKSCVATTLLLSLSLSACANLKTPTAHNNGATQWDFDHGVQYRQTNLARKHYQLEVIPNKKVSFDRLSVFLLRKSYRLCGNYHYKLELIQGIEGFDDKHAMPNYIFPSLIAKIECNLK